MGRELDVDVMIKQLLEVQKTEKQVCTLIWSKFSKLASKRIV